MVQQFLESHVNIEDLNEKFQKTCNLLQQICTLVRTSKDCNEIKYFSSKSALIPLISFVKKEFLHTGQILERKNCFCRKIWVQYGKNGNANKIITVELINKLIDDKKFCKIYSFWISKLLDFFVSTTRDLKFSLNINRSPTNTGCILLNEITFLRESLGLFPCFC